MVKDLIDTTDPSAAELSLILEHFSPATERVVVPLLDERADDRAAEMPRSCFPDRGLVGVPAREIPLGGSNIRCIARQVAVVRVPASVSWPLGLAR